MPRDYKITEEPILTRPRLQADWYTVLLTCENCGTFYASIEMDFVPTQDDLKKYRCHLCQGPIMSELL